MAFTSKGIYEVGQEILSHKGKRTSTVLNNRTFDAFLYSIDSRPFGAYKIPANFAHRPDLISNAAYGTPFLDWFIMLSNNITDPFESLNAGDVIKLMRYTG